MAEVEYLGSKGSQPSGRWDGPPRPATASNIPPSYSHADHAAAAYRAHLDATRPKTAPSRSTDAAPSPSKPNPKARQFGRMSLYDRERAGVSHCFQGPQVLRDMERLQHGFPLKGPDVFLKKGDGHSLRTRVRLKAILKQHPVDRDPKFQKGSGGVHLSWESVPSAQSIFRHLYDNGTIDFVALRWGTTCNELVWGHKERRPGHLSWGPRPMDLELGKWLPIFLEGIREYKEPYRFLSIMGSHDLIEECKDKLHEFAADLVPPLKKALDTREPTVVTIALELMQAMVNIDPQVAQVWIHYLRDFSQVFNLFLSRGFMVNMGYNSHRIQSTKLAINEFLLLMQQHGGEQSMGIMRRYLRTDPQVTDETFQRQKSQAAKKPGHQATWKPFLLI